MSLSVPWGVDWESDGGHICNVSIHAKRSNLFIYLFFKKEELSSKTCSVNITSDCQTAGLLLMLLQAQTAGEHIDHISSLGCSLYLLYSPCFVLQLFLSKMWVFKFAFLPRLFPPGPSTLCFSVTSLSSQTPVSQGKWVWFCWRYSSLLKGSRSALLPLCCSG